MQHWLCAQYSVKCVRFVPPASELWGKVIYSVCLSVHTGGGGEVCQFQVLSQMSDPRCFPQGYPSFSSHALSAGVPQKLVPCPFWGRGYPNPGMGGPPVPPRGYPSSECGVSCPGVPPQPGQDWGTPSVGTEVPPARTGLGYPLARTEMGTPPPSLKWGTPWPGQD